MTLVPQGCIAAALISFVATQSLAATLHGRVKDRQCSVLSRVQIRFEPAPAQAGASAITAVTDDSGDYLVTLPAGIYHACFQRERAAAFCEDVQISSAGDTWITTQLRDPGPDLSRVGNHSY